MGKDKGKKKIEMEGEREKKVLLISQLRSEEKKKVHSTKEIKRQRVK